MTQPSILHMVVNGEVFTIYICCFIAKKLLQISIFTTMRNFVKIGHTRYDFFDFYRATAMLSAVYAVIVCLSVCVSVCHTPVLYQKG